MRGPELDQQTVKLLPFLLSGPTNPWGGVKRVDVNTLKPFGFDRLERRADPLDAQPPLQKLQIFEFCGCREVKQNWARRDDVCERR